MERTKGFTLVELMIVVAIIAIIVTIAIPNLIRSRMSSNEAAAVGGLRTISTAQAGFKTAAFADADGNGEGDYGTLTQLANPDGSGQAEPFIDNVLGGGNKLGYVYTVNVTLGAGITPPSYMCFAVPAAPGLTGYRQYFVDETGVIRFTGDGSAVGPTSTPLD